MFGSWSYICHIETPDTGRNTKMYSFPIPQVAMEFLIVVVSIVSFVTGIYAWFN